MMKTVLAFFKNLQNYLSRRDTMFGSLKGKISGTDMVEDN